MKRSISWLLGLVIFSHLLPVWSADSTNTCYWQPLVPQGPQLYRYDMGSVYIPRDAQVGSVIGEFKKGGASYDENNAVLKCSNDGNHILDFDISAFNTISPVMLPPVNGEDVNGKVIETNISGVGAYIELGSPFNGGGPNVFEPNGPPSVPFTAIHNKRMTGEMTLSLLIHKITLIKTGAITAGPQFLDGSILATSTLSGVGKAFDFGISGTVIQAQCSVSATAVSADPVDLKQWVMTDFSGPGTGTTPVPFSIKLDNCIADPANANIATAHIFLEGAKGSAPIDAQKGIFSLSPDSTAKGFGIQILQNDGITPYELQKVIPIIKITPGEVLMNFKARFIQTGPSKDLEPGNAKGALGFTITYQ